MKKYGKEFLVGCLVLFAVGLMFMFGWLMGVIGPWTAEGHFVLLYGFAGGVEVGSPVRVSGVKVGKVEKIDFVGDGESKPEDKASLKVTVSVARRALATVREDSRFYVNMAGIIGERYIEISPGSPGTPVLASGSMVRGVDPPRIDQLLSQGYGVFGKIQEFLDENEATMTEFMSNLSKLMSDANKFLKGSERTKLFGLIDNLNEISSDIKVMTKTLRNERAQEFFERLDEIVKRANEIDKPALKKFLQEEGVRARIF